MLEDEKRLLVSSTNNPPVTKAYEILFKEKKFGLGGRWSELNFNYEDFHPEIDW